MRTPDTSVVRRNPPSANYEQKDTSGFAANHLGSNPDTALGEEQATCSVAVLLSADTRALSLQDPSYG